MHKSLLMKGKTRATLTPCTRNAFPYVYLCHILSPCTETYRPRTERGKPFDQLLPLKNKKKATNEGNKKNVACEISLDQDFRNVMVIELC